MAVLGVILIVGSLALAVDMTRLFRVEAQIQRIAENAARLTAQNLYLMEDQALIPMVEGFIRQSLVDGSGVSAEGAGTNIVFIEVVQDRQAGQVSVAFEVAVPTVLISLFGAGEGNVLHAESRWQISLPPSEIILVLDRTEQAALQSALEGMKVGAAHFSRILDALPKQPETVRMGVVPLGGDRVNVAPRKAWTRPEEWPVLVPPAVPGIKGWSGPLEEERWCVLPRYGEGRNMPIPPSVERFPVYLEITVTPDPETGLDRYEVTTPEDCDLLRLLPPEGQPGLVQAYLEGVTGHGVAATGTALTWAERMLAPEWSGVWQAGTSFPAAYGAAQKAVILVSGSANADAALQDPLMGAVCDRLKSEGVAIHVVDYQSPPETRAGLQQCASEPARYFRVENSGQLIRAFLDVIRFLTEIESVSPWT
ncbi:hypothetical protein GCM10007924_18940 [Sneathiella chinensis]|uniref:VWFA domain-containing protein n=2 Tax=Sneathiella chinensis TaxID=349750 RepID=A0ABQ5U4M6_9PROT|nr:hypothetical protein GCM10007924_18940 [Sneathiella chinensis]